MNTRRAESLLLALLLACAVTLAAADAAHGHDALAGKACQLCHAAHLPALEATLGAHIAPPVVLAFHAPDEPLLLHAAPEFSSGVTRAPPFSL